MAIVLPKEPGAFPESSVYDGPYPPLDTLPTGHWHVMANGRIYELDIVGQAICRHI